MKTIKKSLAIAALVAAAPLAQAVEVSGNVALTTDYKFRGISQTDGEAAIQGGFDVAFENGFYIGTWGSNVDFANSLELDYYVGYGGSISEQVSYDIGYLYYDYPGDESSPLSDYGEVYGSLSFSGATLGLAYSDDYFAETGEFIYYYVDYELPLNESFTLAFHYGYNDFDTTDFLVTDDSYSDWSIALSTSFSGLDFSLSYVDTNIGGGDCFGEDWCDASAILTVSKSL